MNRYHPHHDEQERRKWQNPEAILTGVGLRPGFIFLDIGCGDGFFALPAARLVGESGKVCGLDINDEAINALDEKASGEGLKNLNAQVGEAEETILCEACADMVFFGIVLHDFRDPAKVLRNAQRMLKPQGRLINLDWKKKKMEFGPPQHIRFDEEEASRLIVTAGFQIQAIQDVGPYHYIIMAQP